MLLLAVTLSVLLLLLFNLLRPFLPAARPPPLITKPSALQNLLAETFEHIPDIPGAPRVLVLYGTEYGFGKEVASKLCAQLAIAGFAPRLVSTLHYTLLDLRKEKFLALVCSTTGDGVPPNEAADLRDALVNNKFSVPENCSFAVLALGDRAYPHFCRAGVVFDNLFGDQGRMLERVDIDQEDWPVIDDWIESFEAALKERTAEGDHDDDDDYLPPAMEKYAQAMENCTDARYSRTQPFKARIVDQALVTAPRTGKPDDKEVVRVEFDIEGSGMEYEVGDAVGVVPRNNSQHVTRVLLALASNGDEQVRVSDKGDLITIETALTDLLDVKTPKAELVVALAQNCTDKAEMALAKRILGYDVLRSDGHSASSLSDWGKDYLSQREVFDVLGEFVTSTLTPQELTDLLRPLHARYYSISSTPITSPTRIAVTVDVLRYSMLNVEREGVASTYLKDRCRIDQTEVGVFVSKNPNFRLPKDEDKHVIMIGPGTGLAPFIAFIEERVETEATGKNWLFFGCRHEKQDFLYGDRLREYEEAGQLRLDTAFSRDTDKKVYVQQRMREKGCELWNLVEDGAHVYVCGDGGRMADDVDRALREIIQEFGDKSEAAAKGYLEQLVEDKRYQRDVWVS